jgi:FkbM family methyltransferase
MAIDRAGVADLIRTLKKRLVPYFLSGKIAGALAWRLYAVRLAFKGSVHFREMIVFCLPIGSGRGTVILVVKEKIDEDIRAFLKAQGVMRYDAIAFGRGMMFPPTTDEWGWLQLLVLFYQIVDLDQYHAKDFMRDGATVIDAGANVGVFACFAATLAPYATIYAFEPASTTVSVLKRNTAVYPNIHLVERGLGATPGTAMLRVKPLESGSSSFADSGMKLSSSVESPIKEETAVIVSIDSFVKEQKLARVDFVKIDSEGYEKQILTGAKETIQKFHPVIAVSAYHHPDDKETIPQIVDAISGDYAHFLSTRAEEDLIFHPRLQI